MKNWLLILLASVGALPANEDTIWLHLRNDQGSALVDFGGRSFRLKSGEASETLLKAIYEKRSVKGPVSVIIDPGATLTQFYLLRSHIHKLGVTELELFLASETGETMQPLHLEIRGNRIPVVEDGRAKTTKRSDSPSIEQNKAESGPGE